MGVHSAKGGGREIQNYAEQHKNRLGSEVLGCREQSNDVKSTRRALVSFSILSFCARTPASHAHTHTRSQTNTALTPASAVSRCSSAHLQLLLLLHRQCHCPQGCASHNAESTKRAAGLVGYCEQRSHLPLFLLCTRALKRTQQAESHTAIQHCTHDKFCSALLLLSASAITAAPSVPMLLLRRLCTP